MVYIPAGLNRARSRNASNLYQDQAAMGVVPSERPAAPPQPGGGVAPSAEGGFTPGGQARPSRMTEYFQQQEHQRTQLAARGEDLRLAQLMTRALDPAMPKGFRQLGLKQVSQMLGIDPRGDRAKEMINTISGLDPQSLEGLRRGVVASTNDAEPGEVSQTVRGVLSGQVPPDQLLQMAQTALQPPAADAGTQGDEPMGLGGPRAAGGLTSADAGSMVEQTQGFGQNVDRSLPPRDTGPARMPSSAAPTSEIPLVVREAQVPPLQREIVPELAEMLGLDSTQRYRNQDVIRGGWRRIPTEADDQRRMATGIRDVQDGVVNTIVMGSQLHDLIEGRPEVLNLNIGRLPYLGDIQIANPSSALVQIGSSINSLAKAFGWEGTKVDPDSPDGIRVLETSKRLANRVVSWSPELQDNANTNAVVQSLMINMAFAMAAAKGQTGRFLSDRDVELQLQELGRSASPEQFQATIRGVLNRTYDHYNVRARSQTGGDVPLGPVATDDARNVILSSSGAPPRFAKELGGTSTPVPRSSSDLVPPATQGANILEHMGERFSQVREREEGPPAIPPRQPQARPTLTRASPTLEEEEAGARQRIEEDRATRHELRSEGRRRLEIAESQEARAQRQEVEARRARIQQAFASIGAALRGAISGGGGGSVGGGGGGDQDPAAFRISPPPQRRPPTPVPAAPFQPQLPQQRQRRR